MIVYKYDGKGFYTGTTTAQESPRETGIYLIPSNTTKEKPPETAEHECVVFESMAWIIKPDFRGVIYWLPDGSEHTITEIDIVPPDDALYEQPIIPPTFEEASEAKLREINAACNAAMKEYVKDYPELEINTFDEQLKEANAYTADNTAETPILTIIARKREITIDDLVQRVLAKADEFKAASASAIGQRQALNDQLMTATTVEEVEAIEVNITVDPPTQTKTKKGK